MAYSSNAQILPFLCVRDEGAIVAVNAGINVQGDASADVATMIVPLPLVIYGFGFYSQETGGATLTGSIFLESSTVIAGSDTTIFEFDLDAVSQQSGDNRVANVTAAAGAESVAAGDVTWAEQSEFPRLIAPGVTLTVRHVNTAANGTYVPFIYAEWMPMDFRPANVWSKIS